MIFVSEVKSRFQWEIIFNLMILLMNASVDEHYMKGIQDLLSITTTHVFPSTCLEIICTNCNQAIQMARLSLLIVDVWLEHSHCRNTCIPFAARGSYQWRIYHLGIITLKGFNQCLQIINTTNWHILFAYQVEFQCGKEATSMVTKAFPGSFEQALDWGSL